MQLPIGPYYSNRSCISTLPNTDSSGCLHIGSSPPITDIPNCLVHRNYYGCGAPTCDRNFTSVTLVHCFSTKSQLCAARLLFGPKTPTLYFFILLGYICPYYSCVKRAKVKFLNQYNLQLECWAFLDSVCMTRRSGSTVVPSA